MKIGYEYSFSRIEKFLAKGDYEINHYGESGLINEDVMFVRTKEKFMIFVLIGATSSEYVYKLIYQTKI